MNARAAILVDFRQRIDDYMEIREELEEEVREAEPTSDPALIRQREQALAQLIRQRGTLEAGPAPEL